MTLTTEFTDVPTVTMSAVSNGSSSTDDSSITISDESGSKIKKRETWGRKLDFLLACIGFSVGLGNVWRFPFLCYKNGGGAFLIPYLLAVILGGVPVFFLEVSLGQFMSEGGVGAWKICPLFQGIGYACSMIVFFLDCNYNIILTWSFYYLFSSFTSVLPWSSCGHEWNSENCTEIDFYRNASLNALNSSYGIDDMNLMQFNETTNYIEQPISQLSRNFTRPIIMDPITEFWERKVLNISDGVEHPGTIKWDLALCLLLAWIVVYFCGGGHHGHSDKEIAEHTLHYASLAILCIFLVEVICKVIAEGTHLLKHKAEVLDAIVVVVSFTLDIVFSFVDVAQAAKDAAGLMVMLRLWRITRIINGVIISVQMEAEKKINKVEKLLHAAENENEYLREEIAKLKEELESVRKKQKKDDGKSLESVSQKTDDDLMGKTVLTPSTATTTTLSSPTTQTSLKEHKSTASNTQNSSKSMFVVFDDLNKSETDSNTGTSRTNECLGPKPPVFVVPTQIIEDGSPKHSCSNSSSQPGDHSQQKLNFKPSLHAPIPNTTEDVTADPFNSLPESTRRKQTPLSPVQNISPLDISGSKPPSDVPKQQTLGKPSSKTSSVDPSSIDQHRKQSTSSTMATELECKDGNLDKAENLQNEIPPAIKTSRRSPTDKDEITEPKSPYQINSAYVESQNRPAAIILPPINVNSSKKSGQTTNYIALKSPRQRSPVGSENIFSGVDNNERRKSFIEDKMFDSPTQKDPGAPR